MTQELDGKAPAGEEQSALPEGAISAEDFARWRSGSDRRISVAEKSRDEANQAVQKVRDEVQELRTETELSGLDDEEERTKRRELARLQQDLDRRERQLAEEKTTLNQVGRRMYARDIAREYDVEEESLLELPSIDAMRAAAANAALQKLRANGGKGEKEEKEETAPPVARSRTEAGEALRHKKTPLEMTNEEFDTYWASQRREAAQRR
jgi:vacuolar-type H+-ATPase subunit I/STV1